jgi:hypothetical protein
LLLVLNHGQWLLLNIGRFSIDECLKDEQSYIKTRLIVTLLHYHPHICWLFLGVVVRRALMQPELPYRFQ